MNWSSEIWIALIDPHERGAVDGAWSLSVPKLEAGHKDGAPLCVLTEERIRCCLQGLMPDERILTPGEGRLPGRSPLFPTDLFDGIESLMLLAAAMEKTEPSSVRTFGLRAGVLGRVLAESRKLPLKATLASPASWALGGGACMDNHLRRLTSLGNWITAGAVEVETTTAEEADALKRRVLAADVDLRAFDEWPETRGARPSSPGPAVAILASADDATANEAALRSMVGLSAELPGLRIHWLARRRSLPAMRAAQCFRRLGLASALTWEDEPWRNPPWRSGMRWDLLLVIAADPIGNSPARPPAWGPLAEATRATGAPVVVITPEVSCATIADRVQTALSSGNGIPAPAAGAGTYTSRLHGRDQLTAAPGVVANC